VRKDRLDRRSDVECGPERRRDEGCEQEAEHNLNALATFQSERTDEERTLFIEAYAANEFSWGQAVVRTRREARSSAVHPCSVKAHVRA
jgi:hypothetical protein